MAYLDTESPVSTRIIVGVLVAASLSAIWQYTPLRSMFVAQTTSIEAVEAELLGHPTSAPIANALKASYPDQLTLLSKQLLGSARAGDDARDRQIIAAQFIQSLIREKSAALMRSADENLMRLAKLHADYFAYLRNNDPERCGQQTSTPSRFLTDEQLQIGNKLESDYLVSLITASKDGEIHPVQRSPKAISQEELRQLVAKMQSLGLTKLQLSYLLSPDSVGMGGYDRCQALYIKEQSFAELQPKLAGRLISKNLTEN